MIYLGSPQMSALGTGLKKRPNYVDIINAQTPFLPAFKAQELEADYQKQAQDISQANLELEEEKLALAKDTQAQQQQQAKTSNMIGLAGLGVNTGLGYLQAAPYINPLIKKAGSLLGLGTSTLMPTAGISASAAEAGATAAGSQAGLLGTQASAASLYGGAEAASGISGAAAEGVAGGASLTTTLASYIAPALGGYIGSEIGGKIAGEEKKQEGQMFGGMIGGAATGAAVGALGGPIVMGVGAIIGGFVGILSGALGAASQKSTFNPAVTFRKPMYLESSYRSGLLTKEDVQGFLGADWQPSSKGWNITGAELPSPMWGKVFNEENRLVHLKMLGVTNPLPLSEINKATEEEKTKMDAWRNTMAGAQWAGSGASVAQVNVNL